MVLLIELMYGFPRVLAYNEVAQDQHRCDDAVLPEENRLRAAMRAARYQQACVAIIAAWFMPGVLRKATLSLGAFSLPRVQTS